MHKNQQGERKSRDKLQNPLPQSLNLLLIQVTQHITSRKLNPQKSTRGRKIKKQSVIPIAKKFESLQIQVIQHNLKKSNSTKINKGRKLKT